MGAESSKNKQRNEITVGHLEDALENQRKLYEKRTKELLAAQREVLTKSREKQSTSQDATSSDYKVTAASNNALYPRLPTVPTTNAHEALLYPNGRMHFPPQPSIPSAPPVPNHLSFETQTSAYVATNLTSITPPVFSEVPAPVLRKTFRLTKQECPNHLDGCTLRFNESEMIEHLLECPFKDLSCPVNIINTCAWKGKITQLVNHFDENHPDCRKAKVNKEDTVHIGQNYQFINLIDVGTYNFLLHIIILPHTKKIIFGVQILGTKISAAKWTYELRIYNKNDPRRLFEYKDSCYSNSIPLHKLLVDDKFATICFDYAKTFSQREVITYKLFLKKIDSRNNYNNRNSKQQYSRPHTKV